MKIINELFLLSRALTSFVCQLLAKKISKIKPPQKFAEMRCIIFIIKRTLIESEVQNSGMLFINRCHGYLQAVFSPEWNKYNGTNETTFAHYHLGSCFKPPEEVIITKFFSDIAFHKSDMYFTKSVAQRERYYISTQFHPFTFIRWCILQCITEHNAIFTYHLKRENLFNLINTVQKFRIRRRTNNPSKLITERKFRCLLPRKVLFLK